jgi:hypothetical protein
MSRLANRPKTNHAQTAAKLRSIPGEWHRIGTYRASYSAASIAHSVRTGYRSPSYLPAGSFEARTEVVEDGTSVWAQYVGGGAG